MPDHLASQAAKSSARLDEVAPIVQPAQLLQTVVVDPARDVVERVAQEMHVAALIGRLRENLAQCCPQAGMIVGHDKFDAMQTTGLQLDPYDRSRPEQRRLTEVMRVLGWRRKIIRHNTKAWAGASGVGSTRGWSSCFDAQ